MEHVALRARINHEADNWIIQTDAPNAFNPILRKPMLEHVAACTPALTGFVAKCDDERLTASVFFQMDSTERTKIECFRGVNQGDAMGPVLFFLPLRPVLMRVCEAYESQGVEAYAYLDDVTVAADDISPGTVGVVLFLERELTAKIVDSEEQVRWLPWPRRDTCSRRKRYRLWQELVPASRTREV